MNYTKYRQFEEKTITEEEVLRYLQKNLDEQEQVDEIIGKIKSAIAKHKENKAFKADIQGRAKLMSKHAKHASDHQGESEHHADHHQAHGKIKNHISKEFHKNKAKPKEFAVSNGIHKHKYAEKVHGQAKDDHEKAKNSHDLAKKAAEKGDRKAYQKHSDAAKKHTEKARDNGKHAKNSGHDAMRHSEDEGHDTNGMHTSDLVKKKHGGWK